MTLPHVLIVGGGIGGLTAALCLAEKGISSSVFEQSVDFTEIGAGIQLSPNCTRVLCQLGLDPLLAQTAFLPTRAEIRNWKSGKLLSTSLLGKRPSTLTFPYYHIHRADLMSVLQEAAKNSPLVYLQTNARISSISQDENQVKIVVNGDQVEGQVLVGADGIHSFVRERLFGVDEPRFTGHVAWRGLVAAKKLPRQPAPVAGVWWGPGKHFVHYYVRGGTLINCVCVVEKPGWQVESWSERGERDELKKDFSGWHEDIQMLIDNLDADGCYKWALYDRDPMPQWSYGRMTLLGDACHATLPFLAQGAAMAIEDAAVLARCLKAEDARSAILKYESLRRSRTARIQAGSRRNAMIFHLGGMKAWLRNRTLFANPAQRILQGIYDYNAYVD